MLPPMTTLDRSWPSASGGAHYIRFSYQGSPPQSGSNLVDMMAENAMIMGLFDNRPLYRIKAKIEESMEK
jgi:hypothetical protein